MELIKENIEYEQLLSENFANAVVKSEYLIPDTHPDVSEILMVDVKPIIIGTEVLQDKIYLEGQVEYNVLYLAREEEKVGVYKVNYTDKFSNHIEIKGSERGMICEAECFMEHMDSTIINERKVSLGGIIKLKSAVYKDYSFEIVKDIADSNEIQMLKSPAKIDKIAGAVEGELIAKAHMQIDMDKPQVGGILKYNMNLHKKEVKLYDGVVQVSAFAMLQVLYRAKDSREIISIKEDVFISNDMNLEGIDSSMDYLADFEAGAIEVDVKEDELGESRIIDLEAVVSAKVKVIFKKELHLIDDVYSTQNPIDAVKRDYSLNVMKGHNWVDTIVKENIEISDGNPKPISVVFGNANVIVTDKKIVEDKVKVEGVLKINVLYNTAEEDKYIFKVSEEIPFSCLVDIPGSKIDMQSIVKAQLENFEASIEANTIAIKAVVTVYARVNYIENKEFLVEVASSDGELQKKKASITIYVVQPGDNLWKIAKRYCSTIEELVNINDIENPDKILQGQKILVPGRAII
jgi:LysM repeat protein